MGYDTLIKGGKVVMPRVGIQDVDIAINKNKVAALSARGSGVQARAIIDASNKYVMPGVIDTHVHWGHEGAIAPEIPVESRASYQANTAALIARLLPQAPSQTHCQSGRSCKLYNRFLGKLNDLKAAVLIERYTHFDHNQCHCFNYLRDCSSVLDCLNNVQFSTP